MKFILLISAIFSYSTLALADSSFCSSRTGKKLAYYDPETYYGEEKTTIAIKKLRETLTDECKALEKAGTKLDTIIEKIHQLCHKAAYDLADHKNLEKEQIFSFQMSCQAGRDAAKGYSEGFKVAKKAENKTCTDKSAISDLSRAAKEMETQIQVPPEKSLKNTQR